MPATMAMRRHDDRPGALAAGIDDRVVPVHPVLDPLDREIDQHDGVLGHDAHQHQDADDDRHRHGIVGEQQRPDNAAERQRQRQEDGDGWKTLPSSRTSTPGDHQEAGAHRHREAGKHLAHDLGIAGRLRCDGPGGRFFASGSE